MKAVLTLFLVVACSGCAMLSGRLPDYDALTLSSNWDGPNASVRYMNYLAPQVSQSAFEATVRDMRAKGCNSMHLFLCNYADGQPSGYSPYGKAWSGQLDAAWVKQAERKLAYARSKRLGIALWWLADDSSPYTKRTEGEWLQLYEDVTQRTKLLAYASYTVLALEQGEHDWPVARVARQIEALRALTKKRVGTHENSGGLTYAHLGDIPHYQVDPGKSAVWIVGEAARVHALLGGRFWNFFELDRKSNRTLSEAALAGGAFAVGNW